MDQVWIKLSQCLGAINGESVNRKDYVTTPEVQETERILTAKEKEWDKWLETLSESDRGKAEEMKDCLEAFSSAQGKRAYMQGYVDCVQVLSHMGLLKRNEKLKVYDETYTKYKK